VFNVYGPHKDRVPLWGVLLSSNFLIEGTLILSEDLNFTTK
jgi:hypothetical protein